MVTIDHFFEFRIQEKQVLFFLCGKLLQSGVSPEGLAKDVA